MNLVIAVTLLAGQALADPPSVIVHHAHVRVGDVVPTAPKDVAEVDLGPAPFPGSSREFRRDEVVARIARAGLTVDRTSVAERTVVRMDVRQLSPAEQQHFADSAIARSLPPGAQLISVAGSRTVTVPTDATVTRVVMPTVMKRRGIQVLAATAELSVDDVVVTRVPIFCSVQLSEEASRPDVRRGEEIRATAGGGAIRISTAAVALKDASIGETAQVQITATGRIVRARVESRDEVLVMDSP